MKKIIYVLMIAAFVFTGFASCDNGSSGDNGSSSGNGTITGNGRQGILTVINIPNEFNDLIAVIYIWNWDDRNDFEIRGCEVTENYPSGILISNNELKMPLWEYNESSNKYTPFNKTMNLPYPWAGIRMLLWGLTIPNFWREFPSINFRNGNAVLDWNDSSEFFYPQ